MFEKTIIPYQYAYQNPVNYYIDSNGKEPEAPLGKELPGVITVTGAKDV